MKAEVLRRAIQSGQSGGQIAKELNVPHSTVCRWLQQARKDKDTVHAYCVEDRLSRLYLQRATLLHLLDLKRAGHSPTRTELRIKNDLAPAAHSGFRSAFSFMSSSAAWEVV